MSTRVFIVNHAAGEQVRVNIRSTVNAKAMRGVVTWRKRSHPNPAAMIGVKVKTAAVEIASAVCKPLNISTK